MNDYNRTIRERFMEIRNSNGKLPAFAWPGGYPIIYVLGDGAVLCAGCADRENGSEACFDGEACEGWKLEGYDGFYEGPSEFCAHCNKEIESAYGDPDVENA